jgi:hypothetical protein
MSPNRQRLRRTPQALGRWPFGQPLTAREAQEADRDVSACIGQAGVVTMGGGALSAGGGRAGRIQWQTARIQGQRSGGDQRWHPSGLRKSGPNYRRHNGVEARPTTTDIRGGGSGDQGEEDLHR